MNPTEVKREMLQEIMKMAGEARMKGMKAKYSPPAEAGEPASLEALETMDRRGEDEGTHRPLSDEDLASLLD